MNGLENKLEKLLRDVDDAEHALQDAEGYLRSVSRALEGAELDRLATSAKASVAALEAIGDWLRSHTDYVGSPESDPTRFAGEVVAHLERMRGRA